MPEQKQKTDLTAYVKQLNDLKMQSMDQYNAAMKNYQDNYPEFYAQLMEAMKESTTQASSSKLKEFLSAYKYYLVAIGIGVGVIIYLLFLILSR